MSTVAYEPTSLDSIPMFPTFPWQCPSHNGFGGGAACGAGVVGTVAGTVVSTTESGQVCVLEMASQIPPQLYPSSSMLKLERLCVAYAALCCPVLAASCDRCDTHAVCAKQVLDKHKRL